VGQPVDQCDNKQLNAKSGESNFLPPSPNSPSLKNYIQELITTGYGLDGCGSISGRGKDIFLFSTASRLAPIQ
jgi:hypothetical protein